MADLRISVGSSPYRICPVRTRRQGMEGLIDPAEPRGRILSRLLQDLVGPKELDEVLDSRPSDVYLTGILWPKNTVLAAEEDERLAMAQGEGEEGEEASDSGQAVSVRMHRPSTAGLSFAARSGKAGDAPRVQVR